MPNRYQVSDDQGNTLTLEGDSPPTEQELEEIWEQHHARSDRDLGLAAVGKAVGLSELTRHATEIGLQVPNIPEDIGLPDIFAQSGAVPIKLPKEGFGEQPPRPEELAEMAAREPSPSEALTKALKVSPQTVQNAMDVLGAVGDPFMPGSVPDFVKTAGQRDVPPGTVAQIAAGFQGVGATIAGSFIDPVNAVAMATGLAAPKLAPLISLGFGAEMAAHIPEQARQAGEASVTGTPYEQTEAFGNLAVTAAFMPGLGTHFYRGGIRPAIKPTIQAVRELMPGGELLKAERLEAEQWLKEHTALNTAIQALQSDPALGTDPLKQRQLAKLQANQKAIGLSAAHQKIIDEQSKDSPLPVEVVWGAKRKPGQYAGVRRGPDGTPEAIQFYGETVPEYIENVARKQRGKAIARTIDEEVVHSRTTPEDADLAAASADPVERWVAQKNYGQKVGQGGMTERDLGYEIIRQRIQKMSGDTREAVEASFEDRLDIKALDVMSRVVRGIRELLGTTKGVVAGARLRAAVDRTIGNIEAAKAATDPDWNVEGGPAAIRREKMTLEQWKKLPKGGTPFYPKGPPITFAQFLDVMDDHMNQWVAIRRGQVKDPQGAKQYWLERDYMDLMEMYPDYAKMFNRVVDQGGVGSPDIGPGLGPAATLKPGDLFPEGETESASRFAKMRAALSDPRIVAKAEKEKRDLALRGEAKPGDEEVGPAAVDKNQQSKLLKDSDEFIAKFQGEVDKWQKEMDEADLVQDQKRKEDAERYRNVAQQMLRLVTDVKKTIGDVGKGSFPAAMSKRSRDAAKLHAMRVAAATGQEPEKLKGPGLQPKYGAVQPAERVGATEAGALPPVSGAELERGAAQQLAGEIKVKPMTRERSEKAGPPRVSYDRPSFDKFVDWARGKMEFVKPHQLRQMWEDRVWSELLKASPERLEEWRKAMGLESKYGTGPVAQAPPPETTFRLEQEFHEGKRYAAKVLKAESAFKGAKSRYRNKLILAIAEKLIGESIEDRPDLSRKEIIPDDVDSYRDLRRDEVNNEDVFHRLIRERARGSSTDPESATRRLIAVVDPDGRVDLLSTYNDAGVQRVTDPTGPKVAGRPHRTLDANFLRRYRPFATLLLKDPVRGFHSRFESVSEFMDKIGKEASERSRIGEYGFAGEGPSEGFEAEGTEGLKGEGGGFTGPSADIARSAMGVAQGSLESRGPMTDREAGAILEHVLDEVGDFASPYDVRESLAALTDRAGRKKLTPADWIALSGYNKAFRSLERRFPDKAREDLIDAMSKTIYENFKDSPPDDPAPYVAKTLAAFAPKSAEPAGPISARQAPAPTGARELTAPSTRRPIPGAGGPPLRGVTGRAAEIARLEAERAATARETAKTEALRAEPREESVFERNVKRTGQLTREAEAEAAAEGPAAYFKRHPLGPTITDAIRNTGSAYDEWMTDWLARVGGAVSQNAAAGFRQITDRAKELYGSLTPLLDPARKAAGAPGRGTTWLHGLDKVTPFAATRRTVDAIEGSIPIPPEAQKAVSLAQTANLAIGRMLQGVVSLNFQASGKFARNITAYAYDIIRQGRGDAWQKWTAGIARANPGLGISQVRDFFRQWKETLDKPGVDVATIERVNQDFARKFPNVITDIKVGGTWQPVVHADLFNYLENAAQRASHIRAFREQFPATTAGRKSLADLMEALRVELGPEHQKDLDALMRTLQGHPTDNYASWGFMSPVRLPGQAFRMLNQTVGNLMARMVLTGQMFVQPGENIAGSTPVFLGYKNYLRGMARLKQLYPQLEQQGAVNRVMYDFSFDPQSPVRSVFRMAGNAISKGFMEQFLNELQEGSAAATAHVVAERIKAGTISDWENRMLPETFQAMGFDRQEASAMMLGDPVLLGQFERKAAAFLTSGNKAVAESSRIGANRLFNSIFRFQTYPMMKTQQFRRVAARLSEAFQEKAGAGPDWAARRAATEQFSRFMFGNALQGALTVGLTTLFYQGWQGLKIKKEEATDDPLHFLSESFLSTISGPLYLLMRGSNGKGITGLGEQGMRMVFPYSITREMLDMAHGAGQYKDLDTQQRIGKFLANKTPGTRAIRTGLSLFGLSQEDRALDASIAAFYRWRRDTLGFRDQEDFLKEDTRKEFRMAMKKAVDSLKNGDRDGFNDAWLKAAGATGKLDSDKARELVADSFRGRKLLKTPDGKPLTPAHKEALQKHIGFDAYDRLEYFDMMIEEAAKGVVLPKHD